MGLAEKATDYQYHWGNLQTLYLLDLTFMVGANKPFPIVSQHQPLEVEEHASLDHEDTFVPKFIVGLLNQLVPPVLQHHYYIPEFDQVQTQPGTTLDPLRSLGPFSSPSISQPWSHLRLLGSLSVAQLQSRLGLLSPLSTS